MNTYKCILLKNIKELKDTYHFLRNLIEKKTIKKQKVLYMIIWKSWHVYVPLANKVLKLNVIFPIIIIIIMLPYSSINCSLSPNVVDDDQMLIYWYIFVQITNCGGDREIEEDFLFL